MILNVADPEPVGDWMRRFIRIRKELTPSVQEPTWLGYVPILSGLDTGCESEVVFKPTVA